MDAKIVVDTEILGPSFAPNNLFHTSRDSLADGGRRLAVPVKGQVLFVMTLSISREIPH